MLKALKEIRRLASTAACDMSDVLEYGSMDKTEEEAAILESIQVRLQAILRNVDEALEANDEG